MSETGTVGRPALYHPEIADEICRRMAEGESLRAICKDAHLPCASTVLGWLSSQNPDYAQFLEQYARSRAIQADMLVEETIEISDDGTNDWMERKGPEGQSLGWTLNGEHVQRSRLRVDTRKWFAGKVAPKKYGDKLDLNETKEVRHVLDLSSLDPGALSTLAALIAEAQSQSPSDPKLIGSSSTNGAGKAKANGHAKPKVNGKAKR